MPGEYTKFVEEIGARLQGIEDLLRRHFGEPESAKELDAEEEFIAEIERLIQTDKTGLISRNGDATTVRMPAGPTPFLLTKTAKNFRKDAGGVVSWLCFELLRRLGMGGVRWQVFVTPDQLFSASCWRTDVVTLRFTKPAKHPKTAIIRLYNDFMEQGRI